MFVLQSEKKALEEKLRQCEEQGRSGSGSQMLQSAKLEWEVCQLLRDHDRQFDPFCCLQAERRALQDSLGHAQAKVSSMECICSEHDAKVRELQTAKTHIEVCIYRDFPS